MDTRLSMLDRARKGDEATWRRLVELYQPLVRGWLTGLGVISQDAEDLAQEVMVVLVRKLPDFTHNGRAGSFRSWLRTIAVNRTRKYWRAGRCRLSSGAAPLTDELLDRLADPNSELARLWDAEHDRHVCGRLLRVVEQVFEPTTVKVFQRLVIDQAPTGAVSSETGLSPAAIYAARYRVINRLRREATGLMD